MLIFGDQLPKIPNQKHLFSIPENITYLNCAYMAPQMKHISDIGYESVRGKESPWVLTPNDFFESSEQVRALFAQIINSTPDDVAIIPSVSYGMAIATKNLRVQKGHSILVLEGQFPSNVYPWIEKAKESNAELVTIQTPKNGDWTNSIINEINDKTDIVAISHNHWTDGSHIDLKKVRNTCDQYNSILIIDATQSLGAKPFNVKKYKPDFLITAGYKWLLGPYSLGYMYVDPKHQNGDPLEYNWLNKAESENFAELVNYKDHYQSGARRFDMGERSQFATIRMSKAALKQIIDWGVENISESLEALTSYIAEKARNKGLSVHEKQFRSPHLIGIQVGSEIPSKTIEALSKNQIHVSARGTKIRIAPHLYNDKNDIDTLFHYL